MKRWVTSDLHLGHPYVAVEQRGFVSVAAHDAAVIDTINSLVAPGDYLYLAGDIAFNEIALDRTDLINGYKILIPGNHDAPFGGHRRALHALVKWAPYFDVIAGGSLRIDIGGYHCLISHFPHWGMPEAHAPGRYKAFRPGDDGEHILLHGHTHQDTMFTEFPAGSGKMWPRAIHIGWDAHFAPVPEQHIAQSIPQLLKLQGETS